MGMGFGLVASQVSGIAAIADRLAHRFANLFEVNVSELDQRQFTDPSNPVRDAKRE